MHILTNSQRRHECSSSNNNNTMPGTIYYRTFPISKPGTFPSPNTIMGHPNAKRSRSAIEPMSLGPPAKVAKIEDEEAETPWTCTPSAKVSRTGKKDNMQQILKPIIDKIQSGFERADEKEPISLATADASLSHIPPNPLAMKAIVTAVLRKPHTTLYTHSCGTLEARRAIASHHKASPEDVIVTNGCSAALDLSLASILDPGTKLLVPNPGFPLYEELAESHGATTIQYNLDPLSNWECDLDHLEHILQDDKNEKTIRAMVINNPSSHGAVFSLNHLLQLLDFATKHKLLLISDEVYGDLTFGSNVFYPLASIAAQHGRKVPVITTSGLSKQFLVPGWRLGWVVFQDNKWGSLKAIREGAQKLMKLQHGVSHLMQSAIPSLLSRQMTSWKKHLTSTLEKQAKLVCSKLEKCPGLSIKCQPQGSMYTIVHLAWTFADDADFCLRLVEEENVFVLPGTSFGVPGTFRIAFSASPSTLETACSRIADFCQRHSKAKPSIERE